MNPEATETLETFGWLALLDGLRVINDRDPALAVADLDALALADYVARRRDVLIQHHQPHFQPAPCTS